MSTWQPQDLLKEIAGTKYFESPDQQPDALVTHLEQRAGISAGRALDLLTSSGLAAVRYAENQEVHAKDRLDQWRLELTDAGLAVLRGEP